MRYVYVASVPADEKLRYVDFAAIDYIQTAKRILGFPVITACDGIKLTAYSDQPLSDEHLGRVYPGVSGWRRQIGLKALAVEILQGTWGITAYMLRWIPLSLLRWALITCGMNCLKLAALILMPNPRTTLTWAHDVEPNEKTKEYSVHDIFYYDRPLVKDLFNRDWLALQFGAAPDNGVQYNGVRAGKAKIRATHKNGEGTQEFITGDEDDWDDECDEEDDD